MSASTTRTAARKTPRKATPKRASKSAATRKAAPHWSTRLPVDACSEARAWARTQPSAAVAWRACRDAQWMLWLAGRAATTMPERRLIVLAACACARQSLGCVRDGEERPQRAIETAEAWTRGEATIEQVREARRAAADADADADAAAAAADADAAAAAASYASYAAASAAAYAASAADAAARTQSLAASADVVRGVLAVRWRDGRWRVVAATGGPS